MLLPADAKKRLDCTDSPWAHREICMCCCSLMQRNVSTVQVHCSRTAKSLRDAAHRCKETSRLYRFTIGTPRNLTCVAAHRCKETSQLHRFTIGTPRNSTCVAAHRCKTNVSTVQTHQKHPAKFTCVAAHRCKETSGLYRLTRGTPLNLHVLLLTDAKKRLNCTDSP